MAKPLLNFPRLPLWPLRWLVHAAARRKLRQVDRNLCQAVPGIQKARGYTLNGQFRSARAVQAGQFYKLLRALPSRQLALCVPLLAAGFPGLKDAALQAALAIASDRREEWLVLRWLKIGADINGPSMKHAKISLLASAVLSAQDWSAEDSEWEWVRFLLRNGAISRAEAQSPLLSPIMAVLQTAHFKIVADLVSPEAIALLNRHVDEALQMLFSPVNAMDEEDEQQTALTLKLLLDAGFVPLMPYQQRTYPLHRAVHLGLSECLSLLWERFPHMRYEPQEAKENLLHSVLRYAQIPPEKLPAAMLTDSALWEGRDGAGLTPPQLFEELSRDGHLGEVANKWRAHIQLKRLTESTAGSSLTVRARL